ncbi:DNA sulfur modification protein DndB [Oxalobacteraceae sp. CFBP 8763]|nr:DNA sulfur modification protein DndB [Oxalobacteraceae sp. CFBP 8763]
MNCKSASHSFPAVQGKQAGKEFFIAMCPLKLIPRLFVFNEEEVPPEMRAQRTINRARIPAIAEYLVKNPQTYILSALTASVGAKVHFKPYCTEMESLGILHIPMDAQILINDGQHRRAAIETAIKLSPELANDNIPVLFFVDEGLGRSQQMFADLNQYAVKPDTSLTILYDHRSQEYQLARYLASECGAFKSLTELEKSKISNRSTKLFTLSGIKHANRALLRKNAKDGFTTAERILAKEFWDAVAEQIPDWKRARAKEVLTSDLRLNYIHAHGVALHAIGIAGAALLETNPGNWKNVIRRMRQIDWSRSNSQVWEGRATLHGRISKATTSIRLTANFLKLNLGLDLTDEEQTLEEIKRTQGK